MVLVMPKKHIAFLRVCAWWSNLLECLPLPVKADQTHDNGDHRCVMSTTSRYLFSYWRGSRNIDAGENPHAERLPSIREVPAIRPAAPQRTTGLGSSSSAGPAYSVAKSPESDDSSLPVLLHVDSEPPNSATTYE
eukprot:389341-Amphidinium_carterae.1